MAEQFILVTGNTYPVKDQIKALGARWNANMRGWMVPASKLEEARALVAGAPRDVRASVPQAAAKVARRANWRPCGYPGCSPSYCDECDGKGAGRRGDW